METTRSELVGFGSRLTATANNNNSSKRDYGGGGGGGGGPSGPRNNNNNNIQQVSPLGDMYDVVGSAPSAAFGFSFNNPISSSGGGGGGEQMDRIPFTVAQWQELERQTMIYKHFIASLPVPPQLIIPISNNIHHHQSNRWSGKASLELGLSTDNNNINISSAGAGAGAGAGNSGSTDPEPWRCRRTDGKKWRCSRDVAPDQKYCERHSHKSRPRSRKPVELHTNSNNNNNNNNSVPNTAHLVNQRGNFLNQSYQQIPVCPNVVSPADAASFDYRKYFGGFIQQEETQPFASHFNSEWQQVTRDSTRVSVIRQQEHDLNSNINFGSNHLQTEECRLSPYPNRRQEVQETIHFIDAWSTEPRNIGMDELGTKYCSSIAFKDKLPLTLSMPGGSEHYKDIMGSDNENASALKPHPQWGSWMDSPPGGPLAEALCLGIGARDACLNVDSPHGSSTTTSSSHGDGGRRSQFK
ncbi:hypothetical protein ACFE04_007150 [Oxalis oulophora]